MAAQLFPARIGCCLGIPDPVPLFADYSAITHSVEFTEECDDHTRRNGFHAFLDFGLSNNEMVVAIVKIGKRSSSVVCFPISEIVKTSLNSYAEKFGITSGFRLEKIILENAPK